MELCLIKKVTDVRGVILSYVRVFGLNSAGSGWSPVAGSCEHGNEPSGSVKGDGVLDQLNDYQLLKEDSASWI